MLKLDVLEDGKGREFLHLFPLGSQRCRNKINCNRGYHGCHGCHEIPSRKFGFLHVTTLHTAASEGPICLLAFAFRAVFFQVISQPFISLLPPSLGVGNRQCQTYTSALMKLLGIQHSYMKISVVFSSAPLQTYSMSIVLRWVNFAAPSLSSPAVPGPTDIS